jgi:hypothetical protein
MRLSVASTILTGSARIQLVVNRLATEKRLAEDQAAERMIVEAVLNLVADAKIRAVHHGLDLAIIREA